MSPMRWLVPVGLTMVVLVSSLHGQGKGFGPGKGQGADFWQDKETFHFLLQNRHLITRKVTNLTNGVETVTESDQPQVAARIQEHVASMYKRVEEGRPIHLRDPLFAEVFRQADKITMKIKKTKKGVRVRETSTNPHVVRVIQAHAQVVSQFLQKGHIEVRKNHPVPD